MCMCPRMIFRSDPGAKSVSLLSPTILEERSSEACRFWLSDSKCRRNEEGICRFAHPTPSSVRQFVMLCSFKRIFLAGRVP